MASGFSRRDYAVVTTIGTTCVSGVVVILNKLLVEASDEYLFIFGLRNGFVRVYDRSKELVKDASVTTYSPGSGVWTNPDYDRDYNRDTAAVYTINEVIPESTLRIYDLGSVAERYLYYRLGRDSGTGLALYISTDGSSWQLVTGVAITGAERVERKTFRYIKLTTSAYEVPKSIYIHAIEAYDVNDPVAEFSQLFNDYVLTHYDSVKTVIADAERVCYALYRFRKTELTFRRGVVEI